MRFRLQCTFLFSLVVGLAICRPLSQLRTDSPAERRLFGILGDEGHPPPPAVTTTTPVQLDPLFTLTPALLTGHVTSTSSSENAKSITASSNLASATSSGSKTTGTLPTSLLVQSGTSPVATQASSATPVSSSSATTATTTEEIGYVGDASTTPPAELTQWKVIGIGVITVTFIAILIISITFFDSWWGFLRAVICGERRKNKRGLVDGEETMVPDWEKRSWEFRLASEDGHRYPTMASLESIVKEKERMRGFSSRESLYRAGIASPEPAYGGATQ